MLSMYSSALCSAALNCEVSALMVTVPVVLSTTTALAMTSSMSEMVCFAPACAMTVSTFFGTSPYFWISASAWSLVRPS